MVRGVPRPRRNSARPHGGGFAGARLAAAQAGGQAGGQQQQTGTSETSGPRRQHVCLRQSGRMTDLTSLTLADARDRLRRREFSATELADAHLAAMEQARALNAYVLETPDRARAMAQAADARLMAGDARPLEGLALGVKDMFATKDVRTTAGSHILDGFLPTYESTVGANLWRDGAGMLGKLNNDEVAMGSSNETSFFGPTISPWRRKGGQYTASAGRLLRRFGRGRRRGPLPRRDGHGYRRLHPPAGGLHRHRRHQADLRALLALGHRGLCVFARPGGTARAHGARCRHPAHLDGGARSQGHDVGRSSGSGL